MLPTTRDTTFTPSITGSGGRFFIVAIPTDIAVNRTLTRLNLPQQIWNNATLAREVVDMHSVDPKYVADVDDFLVQVVCVVFVVHVVFIYVVCASVK